MAGTTPDTRPVDRDYLDARLDAERGNIDARFAHVDTQFAAVDTRMVELELRIVERIGALERRIAAGAGVLLVAVLGTLLAVIVK